MDKKSARIRRATRARRKLQELGATRLVVHRTPRHIYAQVIAPILHLYLRTEGQLHGQHLPVPGHDHDIGTRNGQRKHL